MIDWGLASLGLGSGLVAAFNPCGFAMLPAYLSYFLGLESDEETNAARNILRAVAVGLTLTAGFILLFTVIGILTSTVVGQGTIERRIPYATFGFGILMVPLGISLLAGYEPKLRLPQMSGGTGSRQLPSIFVFGVSYGVVSLSCTAPIFFGTIIGSFTRTGIVDGSAVFVAYALGMSLVVLTLTLAMAMGRTTVATTMRRVLPYVNRVSGGLLVLAGVFLTLYGWWEIQVVRGNLETNWLVDRSLDAQTRVTVWLQDSDTDRVALVAAFIIGGALLFALRSSMRSGDRPWIFGGLLGAYLIVELGWYRADFVILPVIRTIGDVPERVGNWFADPARWPVFFEVAAAVLVATVVWLFVAGRRSGPGSGTALAS